MSAKTRKVFVIYEYCLLKRDEKRTTENGFGFREPRSAQFDKKALIKICRIVYDFLEKQLLSKYVNY